MNTPTPNPLLPQGSLPPRPKSNIYFKVLMILAVHVVVIGGLLMQGCKDTAKDKATTVTTTKDDVATTTTNTSNPMSSTDFGTTPTPTTTASTTTPTAPVSNSLTSPLPLTAPVTTTVPVATVTPPVVAGSSKEYVIVAHDTFAVIAKKVGVSTKALVDANPGVDAKKLQIGHKLQIPASATTAGTTLTPTSGSSATVADATASSATDGTVYTVKPGDVLLRIAHTHGTTVKEILALNDMKTTGIKAGQKLKMPVMKVASAETAPSTTAAPMTATIGAPTTAPAPRAN